MEAKSGDSKPIEIWFYGTFCETKTNGILLTHEQEKLFQAKQSENVTISLFIKIPFIF